MILSVEKVGDNTVCRKLLWKTLLKKDVDSNGGGV